MLSDLGDDAALENFQRHGTVRDARNHVGRHVVIGVDPAPAVDFDEAETAQGLNAAAVAPGTPWS